MNISPNDLVNKIVLLTEPNSIDGKRHYRFNDVIYHKGYYWQESTKFILNQNYLQGTILRTYIECCSDKNLTQINTNNLQILCNIINNKITNGYSKLPAHDELVIHMRIGDVVDSAEFLQKDYIQIIHNYIVEYRIKKVTFCTAFHYGNNITQGLWIYTDEKHKTNINKLYKIFKKVLENFKDLHIDVKSSKNIDDDFIYMVMSNHFVRDIGGFSNLVNNLIAYKRNLNI